MRILVLADVESKYLWDYFEKEKLDGIDLILSCGDLKPQYLSFLASFSKVPILYVHGNLSKFAYSTGTFLVIAEICSFEAIFLHSF